MDTTMWREILREQSELEQMHNDSTLRHERVRQQIYYLLSAAMGESFETTRDNPEIARRALKSSSAAHRKLGLAVLARHTLDLLDQELGFTDSVLLDPDAEVKLLALQLLTHKYEGLCDGRLASLCREVLHAESMPTTVHLAAMQYLDGLGSMTPASRSVVEKRKTCDGDSDFPVNINTILSKSKVNAGEMQCNLIEIQRLLWDSMPERRQAGCYIVGEYFSSDKRLNSDIQILMASDKDETVRLAAMWAIGRAFKGSKHEAVMKALRNIASDGNASNDLRVYAVKVLRLVYWGKT